MSASIKKTTEENGEEAPQFVGLFAGREVSGLSLARPSWLPSYVPELDGLRGLAVLSVVIYHCHPRLVGTWIHYASLWGWAGVNLFFVLSGFLITSILLESSARPQYFRNFYGRRVLRIWPVYVLLLAVCYWQSPWLIGPQPWEAIKAAPWLAYIFFLQKLLHNPMPPAIGPTWSLAIEEQYYFLWAPLVRYTKRARWLLFVLLGAALVGSPLMRHLHYKWLTPTHTFIHLDGIALGSLVALALYRFNWSRKLWLVLGGCFFVLGIAAAATIAGGTSMLDTALAAAFAGALAMTLASSGTSSPLHAILRRGPLSFYGRISYGLYMSHIMVFVFFGWFDLKMDPYGTAGNLAVVGFRLLTSTLVATAMWYGFESRILKLKRYF